MSCKRKKLEALYQHLMSNVKSWQCRWVYPLNIVGNEFMFCCSLALRHVLVWTPPKFFVQWVNDTETSFAQELDLYFSHHQSMNVMFTFNFVKQGLYLVNLLSILYKGFTFHVHCKYNHSGLWVSFNQSSVTELPKDISTEIFLRFP